MHKHLTIIFLFLIFLPIVNASSFTGSFNDYGTDTGSDGLFDYLIIETEVNINDKSVDYIISGILEDSKGSLIEYSKCSSVTKTGNQIFTLNFDGLKIYRNQVNGPYNLAYISLHSVEYCTGNGIPPLPELEHFLVDAYTTQSYPYTQFQKGEPAIYCDNSPCTASSTLIKSRDNIIGTAEPNAPNTIDGCEDGSAGDYLDDESIESITVTSLNNNFFKIGDDVKVDIQVYCDSLSDKLNFAYTNDINNIQWKVKDNKQCSSNGLQTLSTTFALDNNVGQHAIRGIFGFNLAQNKVCGNDNYDDNDDIVIYVKECNSDTHCQKTECNHLDSFNTGCYAGTYRDYHNVQNTCNQNFECTHNTCTVYDEIITDIDNDGYDIECEEDCNDQKPNINQGADEICNNGIDDDCDTYTDMNDPECIGKYEIDLTTGWNLISLPKIDNNSINEIANIFNNDFEKIITLKEGKWYIYDKTPNSNLNELSEANGFWIKTTDNLTVLIDNEAAAYTSFNLKKGWNIIGYPSIEEKDVQELFQNVMDDIEILYIRNSPFKSFNPKKPSNFIIKPGTGILVKAKNNVQWYFDGKYNKGNRLFSLDLSDGWNLISIPLTSDKTKSEIFGSNKLYYLENNKWVQSNGNDKLNYSYGYWINSPQYSLQIQGYVINNLDFNINQGWNLINYPLDEEKSMNTFFQNVMNNIELITTFEDGEWKNFIPSRPNVLNSLTTLKPGKGIFIKAKNNAGWHFDGNELT